MPLTNFKMDSEMDLKLTGSPQITFFKAVYRRHTNFYKGLQSYPTQIIKTDDSGLTHQQPIGKGTFDLITNIFLENKINYDISAPGLDASLPHQFYANLGATIINSIQFKVGTNTLYSVDGLLLEAHAELSNNYIPSVYNGSSVPPIINTSGMCVTGSNYNICTCAGGVSGSKVLGKDMTIMFYTYPNFHCFQSYGNSFPFVAVNNQNIVIEVIYNPMKEYCTSPVSTPLVLNSQINIEYVNLSLEERTRVLNNKEPYIYYDIQELIGITDDRYNATHPIRQLFFIGVPPSNFIPSASMSCNTPYSISENIAKIELLIRQDNVHSSGDNSLSVFTKHNIYKSGYPGFGRKLIDTDTNTESAGYWDSIGIYPFCLDVLEVGQPNGHLSAGTEIKIRITDNDGNTDNGKKVAVYAEFIKFYHILGGQLGNAYIN